MRRWAHAIAGIGTISVLASCSDAPRTAGGESTATVSAADGIAPFQPQYSARVCQLIGDTDFAALPANVQTKNMSDSRFGVRGTDEGSPIYDPDDHKIFFYFGDTNPDGHGYDVVGWTNDLTLPPDGCPTLTFGGHYSNGDDYIQTGAPIVTLDGEVEGISRAPNGGFYNPIDQRLYVFYNVFRQGQQTPNLEGRTVSLSANVRETSASS